MTQLPRDDFTALDAADNPTSAHMLRLRYALEAVLASATDPNPDDLEI